MRQRANTNHVLSPFSPSLKSGLLRRQRLSLAAQSAQPAPAGACGAAGEFFNFSCNVSKKPPFFAAISLLLGVVITTPSTTALRTIV